MKILKVAIPFIISILVAYGVCSKKVNRQAKHGMDAIGKPEVDSGPKCWHFVDEKAVRSYPCFKDDRVIDGRLEMVVNEDKKRYRELFRTTDYAKYNDSMNVAAQNFVAENNLRVMREYKK